jgi:hypothetical protein
MASKFAAMLRARANEPSTGPLREVLNEAHSDIAIRQVANRVFGHSFGLVLHRDYLGFLSASSAVMALSPDANFLVRIS